MATPFKTVYMVDFADTDMAGIMHFANFLRWMERAEHALLRSHGLSVSMEIDGQHYGFPRVHVECDYKKPIRYEEEAEVSVMVKRVGSRSVTYDFEFRKAANGDFLASGSLTAACVTRDAVTKEYRSVSLPAIFREELQEHLAEVSQLS